jgi:hypothetical protein
MQKNVDAYIARTMGKSSTADNDKPAKKLIVDALSIRDARVSYAPALLQGKKVDLPIPNIELRNIGRAKGGVSAGELVSEIVGALKAQMGRAVSRSVRGAAEAVDNAAKSVGDKVKERFR